MRWGEGRQRSFIWNLQPSRCPPHTPGLPEAAVVALCPGRPHSLLRHPAHRARGRLQGPERPFRPQRPAQRAAEPAGEGSPTTLTPCGAKREPQQSPILSSPSSRHNLHTPCQQASHNPTASPGVQTTAVPILQLGKLMHAIQWPMAELGFKLRQPGTTAPNTLSCSGAPQTWKAQRWRQSGYKTCPRAHSQAEGERHSHPSSPPG